MSSPGHQVSLYCRQSHDRQGVLKKKRFTSYTNFHLFKLSHDSLIRLITILLVELSLKKSVAWWRGILEGLVVSLYGKAMPVLSCACLRSAFWCSNNWLVELYCSQNIFYLWRLTKIITHMSLFRVIGKIPIRDVPGTLKILFTYIFLTDQPWSERWWARQRCLHRYW